jgi:adenylate cyclase
VAKLKYKALRGAWVRWTILVLIPTAWCGVAVLGGLKFAENQLVRARYLARGEITAPVKVMYVDIDTRAIQELGERPWSHSDFGLAAQTLLEVGKAKAVGFDLVFSDYSASKMISRDELYKRNFEFGRVTRRHPEIVLGAQYSGGQARLQEGQRKFPLLRKGIGGDRSKNDVPELPIYPLSGVFTDKISGGIKTWGSIGLIDVDYEYGGDEVPRWVPMFAETPNPTYFHLSLELALRDMGLDASAVKLGRNSLEIVRPDGTFVTSIPLWEHQLLEVNWFSRWENEDLNPRASLADVLIYQRELVSDDADVKLKAKKFFERFADAIILVGPVDPLLQDLSPTPLNASPVPKVGLHGNLIKTIRSGLFIRHLPLWATLFIAFGLSLSVSRLAVVGGAKGIHYKIYAAVLVCAFVAAAFYLFSSHQVLLEMAAPLGATFTSAFVAVGWQLLEEEKQKGRIKGMFGTYVSPQLVDRMVASGDSPQLGGHDDEITAYFSDIQAFSTFSEKLGSGPLVELMNEYLTACTDIVQAEGGTLDKYIGDAVVAMFGAPLALPDHAYRAGIASQLVHLKLGELRQKWKSEGEKWPEIVWNMQTRVGLNTGVCMIGNMGSRTRFNYTMMGDNVNLAARMESGSKAYGVYTMVAESTKLACEQHGDRLVFRPLDRIVVKGRTAPVPVYEIVGLKEKVFPETFACLACFAQGIESYLAQDWGRAAELFAQSGRLEPNVPGVTPGVETNPSIVMVNRCQEMKTNPPGRDWDGVYKMSSK